MTVTPATNHNGVTRITLFVSDGTATNSTNFILTVIAVNDAPVISAITDQTTPEDTGTAPISFTVSDVETAAGSLRISGTSTNTTLVPNASLVFGGSGSNRRVTITPATNQSGVTLIRLSVSDGGLTNSTSFLLTVTAVNDAPVISAVTNRTILEDTSPAPISFTVGDVETTAGALIVFGVSSNQALVPDANLVFGGSGSNRTVAVMPATHQNGATLITLFVSDGRRRTARAFCSRSRR